MGRGSPPAYFTVSEGLPGAEIPHEGADAGVCQDRLIQADPPRIRTAEDFFHRGLLWAREFRIKGKH